MINVRNLSWHIIVNNKWFWMLLLSQKCLSSLLARVHATYSCLLFIVLKSSLIVRSLIPGDTSSPSSLSIVTWVCVTIYHLLDFITHSMHSLCWKVFEYVWKITDKCFCIVNLFILNLYLKFYLKITVFNLKNFFLRNT